MHYNFNTLRTLRDAVNLLIEKYGENTYIGLHQNDNDSKDVQFIDEVNMLNVVYIDMCGTIVGDKADDYSPQANEVLAISII
jgi:hypothetical protein